MKKKEQVIIKKLRMLAKKNANKAYAPYSNAHIGAALFTSTGKYYSGCNVENSSYGGTVCAERVAIWKAVSEGHTRIKKIYVYSNAGWPPCGMCRQVMSEFATPEMDVIIGDKDGNETIMKFLDILPLAFLPSHLDHK